MLKKAKIGKNMIIYKLNGVQIILDTSDTVKLDTVILIAVHIQHLVEHWDYESVTTQSRKLCRLLHGTLPCTNLLQMYCFSCITINQDSVWWFYW